MILTTFRLNSSTLRTDRRTLGKVVNKYRADSMLICDKNINGY